MSRSLLSLLLAAAVATVAALGLGVATVAAEADDNLKPIAAKATPLALVAAATEVTPRTAGPARELDDRTAATTRAAAVAARQQPGAGRLLAAAGTSRDPVDAGGRTVTYSVEVEAATGLDPDGVAAIVEEALYDERSWARDHDLRRVAPADASLHVVIATPATTDAICRRVGLRTNGWLSCWSGDTAAINLERWLTGVDHVADLDQYRRYVVNHEVGHGLGHGHRGCPGPGRLAPLMMQQTKSLGGCIANEWAFPG